MNGSFAIRGALEVTDASRVELVARSGRRFSVYAGRPEARVTYTEGAIPILEDPVGVMNFHGWLEGTPDPPAFISQPITAGGAVCLPD